MPAALTFLGLTGSAMATVVAGWIAPVLVCLSVALLGRSFYIIYKHKRASRAVKVFTWLSATFIVGFWTWWFVFGGWQ